MSQIPFLPESVGSAECWETIADVTFDEDLKSIRFENLNYKEIFIEFYAVGSDSTASTTNGMIFINDNVIAYSNNLNPVRSGTKRYFGMSAKCTASTCQIRYFNNNNNTYQSSSSGGGWFADISTIESIYLTTISTAVMGKDSRLRIIGIPA